MEAGDRLESLATRLGLEDLTNLELLQTFAATVEILRARGVARTSNNPVADYTEWLVCSKLGLELQTNSTAGHDGRAADGTRYEIKARRLARRNASVQLSAIRELADQRFDYLIAVLYEVDFSIRYAAKIPHSLVEPHSTYRPHTNSHAFHFRPEILTLPEVEDITAVIAA